MSTTHSSWNKSLRHDGQLGLLVCRVELHDAVEVFARCYPNDKHGGIMLDGHSPGALGEPLELTVAVAEPKRELTVRGVLAWARHRGSRNLKECFGVDFLGGDEGAERLLKFARRELDPHTVRAEPRVPAALPAKVMSEGATRHELVSDLSSGGAFIRTEHPLEVGTQAQLKLRGPGLLFSLKLDGTVAWSRRSGETGFGLSFRGDDLKTRERLARLLRRLQH